MKRLIYHQNTAKIQMGALQKLTMFNIESEAQPNSQLVLN